MLDLSRRADIELALGDALLESVRWSHGGEDLELIFRAAWEPVRSLRVTVTWATRVRVSLDFGELFGRPLVHEATIRGEPGNLHLQVSFGGAPDGDIECDGNDITAELVAP